MCRSWNDEPPILSNAGARVKALPPNEDAQMAFSADSMDEIDPAADQTNDPVLRHLALHAEMDRASNAGPEASPNGRVSDDGKPLSPSSTTSPITRDRPVSCSAAQFKQKFRPTDMQGLEMQPLPGLPMPPSLWKTVKKGAPQDATCYERVRDRILLSFVHPVVAKVMLVLALLVSISVVGMGLVMCWAMVGLFFDIPNGWEATRSVCLNASGWNETSSTGLKVPMVDGEYVTAFCSLNQWWFNACIKVFVLLFSYVNFLPIPWRLASAHHVYCSHRPSEAGVDFYGRPTDAMWFNIPKRTRRKIAVGLNLAWMSHFACVATHLVWSEYIQGQTFPGLLYHNLPFVMSIFFQVSAAVAQTRAENVLIAEQPERFPPRPITHVIDGWRKWRAGEGEGSLVKTVKAEFRAERALRPKRKPNYASSLTGIPGVHVLRPTDDPPESPPHTPRTLLNQEIPGLPIPASLQVTPPPNHK